MTPLARRGATAAHPLRALARLADWAADRIDPAHWADLTDTDDERETP